MIVKVEDNEHFNMDQLESTHCIDVIMTKPAKVIVGPCYFNVWEKGRIMKWLSKVWEVTFA